MSVNKTTEVGRYPANAWRLYDMHGNVLEWCADVLHENYDGAPDDGSAWGGDRDARVLRGGAWFFHPGHLHSAYRIGLWPLDRSVSNGFRVARTIR